MICVERLCSLFAGCPLPIGLTPGQAPACLQNLSKAKPRYTKNLLLIQKVLFDKVVSNEGRLLLAPPGYADPVLSRKI